jgi:hypothetical protein
MKISVPFKNRFVAKYVRSLLIEAVGGFMGL